MHLYVRSGMQLPEKRFIALFLVVIGVTLLLASSGSCCAQPPEAFPTVPRGYTFQAAALRPPHATAATEPLSPVANTATRLDASPWWTQYVPTTFRPASQPIPIDLDHLFALTIVHSGRVQAVAQTPWVSQMQAQQAQAVFDPTLYNNTRFDSTSDPVGSVLTTGGPPRLEDNTLGGEMGVRGTRENGSVYGIGQRMGFKNSNSTFFTPNDQGTTRLFANFTQPLLRGRNIDVNRTLILTAQFDTQVAQAAYQEAIQKQLFQVAETYWSLYIERASLLQRKRHLGRATQIAEKLAVREIHDGASSQILRARAAVTNRAAELVQVEARIRNLESSLRSLINAPELIGDRNAEFLPMQAATIQPITFDLEAEVANGLQRRPEVAEVHSKLGAAQSRLTLARDQVKPTLDLVAEGYVAGLQGDSSIAGAFVDQFSKGRPGYAAGLVYEVPYRRRAANAVASQRQYEITQLQHLLREIQENIRTEVEIAIRNVHATQHAALGRQASLAAVVAEVDYLQDRWLTLGNDPRLGQIQLSELLNSQDRLLQEEQNLLQALVQYNRSVLEVQRATGQLIRFAP